MPPSEIKKAEKEAAEKKLEAHPESVTTTSTTAGALLHEEGPATGSEVGRKDTDVGGSLKEDLVSALSP